MHTLVIENEGLHFLHSILSSNPARSKADSNKQSAVFRAMRPALESYRADLKKVDNDFREYTMTTDPKTGQEVEAYKISRDKRDAYEKAVADVHEKKVEVKLDPESYTVLKVAFDGLFDREEAKEKGMTGEDQMRWISQIDLAFGQNQK